MHKKKLCQLSPMGAKIHGLQIHTCNSMVQYASKNVNKGTVKGTVTVWYFNSLNAALRLRNNCITRGVPHGFTPV